MEDKASKGKEIRVKEIKVDKRMSIRERNDEERIKRYADKLENLPPITVFHTGDEYILADGFHRLAAAERLGWEYVHAEVREGSYQDAIEFAVKANLKHGKPLKDWTQEKLASALSRSQEWVSSVIAAERVGLLLPGNNLDTRTKAEISRAPKELWKDIGRTAQEQEWTRDETEKKVKAIKAEPSRAQEILQSQEISIPEAPADKLIPLTKEIKKLCDMQDEFCKRLDPELYDWGSGALAAHTLHGFYVLAETTTKLAEKTKKMIEFLEAKGKGKGRIEKDQE